VTVVEVLAAALIVSVAVAGAVSLYVAMLTMTRTNRDGTTASELARYATEQARFKGFTNLADGSSVRYYNSSGAISSEASSSGSSSYFSVTTAVSTDKTQSSTTGSRISPLALRTVTVTVRRLSDSRTLETWGTYLARGGV
jgi:Tfp pilus assembly protein PilW